MWITIIIMLSKIVISVKELLHIFSSKLLQKHKKMFLVLGLGLKEWRELGPTGSFQLHTSTHLGLGFI